MLPWIYCNMMTVHQRLSPQFRYLHFGNRNQNRNKMQLTYYKSSEYRLYFYYWGFCDSCRQSHNYYEPFGLGRFATDHSLTKAASRPLFVRVRRYAPQKTTPARHCLCVINKTLLGILPNMWTAPNIHMRNFYMRNSESAYLFTLINIWKQISRSIFNFYQLVYFIINNNNKYSYEKFLNAKFGISTLVYL